VDGGVTVHFQERWECDTPTSRGKTSVTKLEVGLDRNLRFLGDVAGDGLLNIVGFGRNHVSLGRNNGDGTFQAVIDDFSYNSGGWRRPIPSLHLRVGGRQAPVIRRGRDGIWFCGYYRIQGEQCSGSHQRVRLQRWTAACREDRTVAGQPASILRHVRFIEMFFVVSGFVDFSKLPMSWVVL
jgi:hypothetical protein